MERKGNKELREIKDCKESLVPLDRQAQTDRLALMVRRVLLASQVPRVLQDQMERRDNKAKTGRLDQREQLVRQVSLVIRGQEERLETRARRDLKVLLDLMARLDNKVIQDQLDLWG
jgi:hypothetical protein